MCIDIRAALKEIEQDLVKVTEPDYEEIGNLIREIKGEKRTMKQFARDTGISAPTLSRIMNGKVTKPISVENMVSLASHAADQSKAVGLMFQLARANGYMSRGEQQALKTKFKLKAALRQLHRSREEMMSMVIKGALFERGCGMDPQVLEPRDGELPTSIRVPLKYDFDLDISGEVGEYRWAFFCIPQRREDWKDENIDLDRMTRQLVREVSPIFVTDSWQPELYKDYKISFCFADEVLYELFNLSINQAKFNNRFSVILIDDDHCRFMEERVCESARYEDTKSLLSLPPTVGLSFSDREILDGIGDDEFTFIEEADTKGDDS